jgi:membrane protease YdiL (CAAX protease family)
VTGSFDSNNRLFMLAQQGQRFPSTPTAALIVPTMLVLMIVIQILMRLAFRSLLGEGPVADSIAELLGFLSIFVGLWVLLHFWSKRPFWSLGFERTHAFRRLLGGTLIAGAMMGGTIGLVMIPGATVEPGQLQIRGLAGLAIGFFSLLATSVQSSAEEALFRGWLLPAIGVRYSLRIAVILSSLVFALAHATNSPTVLGLVNLFLFGTMAALLALADGGLWSACAWHAIWNWVQGGLLGFSVDGSSRSGLIASIQTSGPDYITGGAFGPDGGTAATTMLLGGIAIVTIRLSRRHK